MLHEIFIWEKETVIHAFGDGQGWWSSCGCRVPPQCGCWHRNTLPNCVPRPTNTEIFGIWNIHLRKRNGCTCIRRRARIDGRLMIQLRLLAYYLTKLCSQTYKYRKNDKLLDTAWNIHRRKRNGNTCSRWRARIDGRLNWRPTELLSHT